MNDNPNWVCENIRTLCGRPARLISSGMVTCFSTSSAARPGKRAMTLTWMSETSGNASIGSDAKATTPAPTNNTVNRRMNSGWPSAKATTRRITRSRASRQLEQPLHEQAARCYDALTAGQAVANRDDTVLLRPDLHDGSAIPSGPLLDKDHVRLTGEHDRVGGDADRRLTDSRHSYVGQHLRFGKVPGGGAPGAPPPGAGRGTPPPPHNTDPAA